MRSAGESGANYVRAACDRVLERVRSVTSGRNDALNRAAFALGQFVGQGALDSDEAKASLMDAALFIGLPRSEAIATIGSGFGAGMRAPRQPTARIGTILSAGQLKAAPSPSCADGLRDARSTRISDIVHGLWMGSRAAEGTPTETYLQQARGIPVTTPTMLRFHPRVWHAEANGHCPAMLGAVVIAGHGMTGLTITYLRPDGGAKADVQPNRRMLGQVKGGGVWLSPIADAVTLLVAEGVETALSVQAATGLPAVAARQRISFPTSSCQMKRAMWSSPPIWIPWAKGGHNELLSVGAVNVAA